MSTQQSKELSWLLRHGAHEVGLSIRSDGYARVSDVINKTKKTITLATIQNIVKKCPKQRFEIHQHHNGEWWIRARQGHSIQSVSDEKLCQRITNASEVPICIHGTTLQNWKRIQTEGLKRMQRNHIHFATGYCGDKNVQSGIRSTSTVFIHLDVQKVLDADIPLYRSTNNVILCPGNALGILSPEYFLRVES